MMHWEIRACENALLQKSNQIIYFVLPIANEPIMIVDSGVVPGYMEGHMPITQLNGETKRKREREREREEWGIKIIEDDNTPYTCTPIKPLSHRI